MAILNLLKLVLANSAMALAISSYMGQGGLPSSLKFVVWVLTYSFFTILDSIGVRESATIQIVATILCVGILLFYSASSFTLFNRANIDSRANQANGLQGFLQGLPFALAFFDGFEEIPLLIGYAINPDKTIPQAVRLCYASITTIAALVFVSGCGSAKESILLASDAPLMVGIEMVYGVGSIISDLVAYLIVLGLVVNFYAFVVYTSQQVQTISEAGFLPSFLSYRHPKHGAPITASIVSSAIGIGITAALSGLLTEDVAQNTLLAASIMPAIIGYVLLLECIIRIREVESRYEVNPKAIIAFRDAEILGVDPKQLRFSYGVMGARFGQMMCVIMFVGLLVLAQSNGDYLYGLLVTTVLGLIMYAVMIALVRNLLEDETTYFDNIFDDANDFLMDVKAASTHESGYTSSGSVRSVSTVSSQRSRNSTTYSSYQYGSVVNTNGVSSSSIGQRDASMIHI